MSPLSLYLESGTVPLFPLFLLFLKGTGQLLYRTSLDLDLSDISTCVHSGYFFHKNGTEVMPGTFHGIRAHDADMSRDT